MRLWTIQPRRFWEANASGGASGGASGALRADGRRLTFRDDFRSPYRWMREQMRRRVPGYAGGFPVWAWGQKPDMRSTRWGAGGERVYRVEFEAPDEEVLVSAFDLWSDFCLLGRYLPASEGDERAFWDELLERTGRDFLRIDAEGFPEDLARRVRASWERVFPDRWGEVPEELRSRYGGRDGAFETQAVVEVLRPDWVHAAEPFTLRPATTMDR